MRWTLQALRTLGHQRWIPAGLRTRAISRLAGPEKIGPLPFAVPFFGHVYEGSLHDFIDWNVFFFGSYSPSELSFIEEALKHLETRGRPLSFVDIGANVGHHSLFASRFADLIVAFEPSPVAAAQFRRKMERNGVRHVLHECALGAEDAETTLYLPNAHNLGTLTLIPEAAGDPAVARVRVTPLDDVEDLPRLDLLKIDVQGYEAAVLRGGQQRIRRDRPVLMLELSREDMSGFGTLDGFKEAIYPDAVLVRIDAAGFAEMGESDLKTDIEIACVPRELWEKWRHPGRNS